MRSDIQFLRAVSAFGIIWFHSGISAGKEIAYGGLVFFLIISVFFSVRSKRQHKPHERILRLLLPFLIWSLVYGVINYAFFGVIFRENYSLLSKILTSPSIHLWFLPFMFAVLVALDTFQVSSRNGSFFLGSGLVSIFLILSSFWWRNFQTADPFGHYLHAIPAVFVGIFLGGWDRISGGRRWWMLGAIAVSLIITAVSGVRGIGVTYMVGLIMSLPLLMPESVLPDNRFIIRVGETTFGVYLVHIGVLFVLRKTGLSGMLLPVPAMIISVVIILVFEKLVPRRFSRYIM